jgi:hypothetical protein
MSGPNTKFSPPQPAPSHVNFEAHRPERLSRFDRPGDEFLTCCSSRLFIRLIYSELFRPCQAGAAFGAVVPALAPSASVLRHFQQSNLCLPGCDRHSEALMREAPIPYRSISHSVVPPLCDRQHVQGADRRQLEALRVTHRPCYCSRPASEDTERRNPRSLYYRMYSSRA